MKKIMDDPIRCFAWTLSAIVILAAQSVQAQFGSGGLGGGLPPDLHPCFVGSVLVFE